MTAKQSVLSPRFFTPVRGISRNTDLGTRKPIAAPLAASPRSPLPRFLRGQEVRVIKLSRNVKRGSAVEAATVPRFSTANAENRARATGGVATTASLRSLIQTESEKI
jgi:hypothetical protein